MKGIILAGGNGTRLSPSTKVISKQLLPIYDKPMIYYSLSMLMFARIKDVLLISSPEALPLYRKLLSDGSTLGMNIEYKEQEQPRGLAEAFIIGEYFIGKDNVCLVLGDNIFFGNGLSAKLVEASQWLNGATIFAYEVQNPSRYGVVEIDSSNKAISIEEKPKFPKSKFAIPGIYFYDNSVIEMAKRLKPSDRGELEISDINKIYMQRDKLYVIKLGRGIAWLDAGTHESMLDSSTFVSTIQNRQGMMISCIEEIAYRVGFINKMELQVIAGEYIKNSYGDYLRKIAYEEEEK